MPENEIEELLKKTGNIEFGMKQMFWSVDSRKWVVEKSTYKGTVTYYLGESLTEALKVLIDGEK